MSLKLSFRIESWTVEAWVAEAIRRVLELDGLEICLVVLQPRPVSEPPSMGHQLDAAYLKMDRRLFGEEPDARRCVSIKSYFDGVPQISCRPDRPNYEVSQPTADLTTLSDFESDICIDFCDQHSPGVVTELAANGCLIPRLGDGVPTAGLDEVMSQASVISSSVELIRSNHETFTLLKSMAATDPTSVSRTANGAAWKLATMLPRAVCLVADSYSDTLRPETAKPHQRSFCRRVAQITSHCVRSFGRKLRNQIQHEQWQILFQPGGGIPESGGSMQRLEPPLDRLWADPFVIESDEGIWLFVEEMFYASQRGHLSAMKYDSETTQFGPPEVILKRDYHLSYPNVFEQDGRFWMIPETSENRQIELYVADSLPGPWNLEAVLMTDVNAVDATLHFDGQLWWMFCGLAEVSGVSNCDETFLFFADDFRSSNWTMHPCSPIVSDVRRARPAGPIIRDGNRLIRPSQDCSKQYGYGVRINEISTLDPEEYEENEIAFLEPDWSAQVHGVHHICVSEKLTVMDVSMRCSRLRSRFAA